MRTCWWHIFSPLTNLKNKKQKKQKTLPTYFTTSLLTQDCALLQATASQYRKGTVQWFVIIGELQATLKAEALRISLLSDEENCLDSGSKHYNQVVLTGRTSEKLQNTDAWIHRHNKKNITHFLWAVGNLLQEQTLNTWVLNSTGANIFGKNS